MNFQSIIALAAKTRDERRMDIDNAVPIMADKVSAQDGEEPGQYDHVDVIGFQNINELLLIVLLRRKVFFLHRHGRNAGFFGAFQGVDPFPAGDDDFNFPAVDDPSFLGVNQRLKIGAAAGHKNCNICCHTKTTFSSPFSI